jgi:AraC-like DNA-binding protein
LHVLALVLGAPAREDRLMPSFHTAARLAAPGASLALVRCDGRDDPRPGDERVAGARVWVVVSGRFAWRDRRARTVADPATALLLRPDEPFEVRHPHGGGDVCLSVAGDLARRTVERVGHGPRPLGLAAFLGWSALAARLRAARATDGAAAPDPLAVEETLAALLDALLHAGPAAAAGSSATRRDVAIADAIDHELRLRIDEPAPLADLAAAAGVSVFHACRAYRRARGATIHQRRTALRLRHAVALLLDTTWPLARVAAECGYATQSHMTNHVRRALATTPLAIRREGPAQILHAGDALPR